MQVSPLEDEVATTSKKVIRIKGSEIFYFSAQWGETTQQLLSTSFFKDMLTSFCFYQCIQQIQNKNGHLTVLDACFKMPHILLLSVLLKIPITTENWLIQRYISVVGRFVYLSFSIVFVLCEHSWCVHAFILLLCE